MDIFSKTEYYRLFIALGLGIALSSGSLWATDDDDDSGRVKRYQLTGLYAADPNMWGEQITFNFKRGGSMQIISDNEQPYDDPVNLPFGRFAYTEFSSQGTGLWKRTGPNSLEFAYVEHRFGNYLCAGMSAFAPIPDPLPEPEACRLIGHGTMTVIDADNVEINITLEIRDRILNGVPTPSGDDTRGPFIGMPAEKLEIEDLLAL